MNIHEFAIVGAALALLPATFAETPTASAAHQRLAVVVAEPDTTPPPPPLEPSHSRGQMQRAGQLLMAQSATAGAVPAPPIEGQAIADWANNVAVATTERALGGIFSSKVRKPLIVSTTQRDAKTLGQIEEDLNVMMRILEKNSNSREESRVMGIDVFSLAGGGTPRVLYIDGSGPLFILKVKYPLLAPPVKDEQARTNENTNSEWEKARQEVYGRSPLEEKLAVRDGGGEDFDADRVEKLKTQLIDDLANATHIRNLKGDDTVTVVVVGSGGRQTVVRREQRSGRMSSGFGGGYGGVGGGGGYAEVRSSADASQTTMTMRAKKSDIDAFAKGKLKADEFQKKVSVQIY